MAKKGNRSREVHLSGQTSSSNIESVESLDESAVPEFAMIRGEVSNETRECRTCEPDEIFNCLGVYLAILKVAGVYFENPSEMERVTRKERARLISAMEKCGGCRASDSREERRAEERCPKAPVALVVLDNGTEVRETKKVEGRLIRSKMHRAYCTFLLLTHWVSVIRMLLMFTPNDSFGPQLLFKMAITAHYAMSAVMATSFYWACASGKFATVMITLSGLKGLDSSYLTKLGTTACWICGGLLALNCGLVILGFFSLEWMYRPLGAPINTWIVTEDETLLAIGKAITLVTLILGPLASFFTSSFGTVYSLIVRRSIDFVRRDLKSYMACIRSVEQKKNILSRPGTALARGKTDATIVGHGGARRWKLQSEDKTNSFLSKPTARQNSIRPGDALILETKHGVTFECLRQRFQFITKLIKRADTFICVCNACGIAGYLSEMILLLYILLWYSCKYSHAWAYLATLSFWLLNATFSLAYISISAVLVNSAAQRVFEKIHDVDLTRYPLEVLHQFSIFLARMSTDNVGFTVLRLFVIDRNTILTIVGLFLTYFLLIYQLHPDNGSYCINLSKPGNDTANIV